jgi:putative SbcD/Mre11-related phosphoesterase
MRVHTDWQLTPQRVAIHIPTATAVLSDPHLGYNAARRRRGDAVPLTAVPDILAPLADVLHRWHLTRIVIAGDLFEDGIDDAVIADLKTWLKAQRAELVAVVPGNHDRGLAADKGSLPVHVDGYHLERWHVVHGDNDLSNGPTVFGHFHPCVCLATVTRPCYLVKDNRLLLPAFSRDARGVDVSKNVQWRGWRRLVAVADEVLDFGEPGA